MPRKKRFNKLQRTMAIIERAAELREEIDKITMEFVRLHEYNPASYEARQLIDVIVNGLDYESAMKSIMERRLHLLRQNDMYSEFEEEIRIANPVRFEPVVAFAAVEG